MSIYYTIRYKVGHHRANLAAVGLIGFFCLLIYLTNLSGDFWISGWDNLHPEFNFRVNLERAFFSSWQEYQGLGLPAGHGHAAEFIRELIIFGASFFLNPQVLRKLFMVLMLFSGSLGTYFFLRRFIFVGQETLSKTLFGLAGAFFYLFNLATLQIFYTPYEAFVVHYGFLPWMIYSLFYFFGNKSRKAYFLLVVVNLLGSAQFYLPTLFFVYLFLVFIVALELKIKASLAVSWKKLVAVPTTIIIVNLYWLLPFFYYSLNNIASQTEAHLNYLYSQDIYLKQAQFGSLKDTALFKSFLFDAVDMRRNGNYDYMAKPWIKHLGEKHIRIIGYAFFALVSLGVARLIRQRKFFSFIFLFLLFFSLLAVNIFPLNVLNKLLRSFSLFDQVFRNPFTKLANSLLFLESVFFAFGIYTVAGHVVAPFRTRDRKRILGLLVGSVILFQIGYVYPVFQGYFIYPKTRVSFPSEYFKLFSFFQDKGDGRIANLPQFTVSGWSFYNWGYGGSGFLWYGIRQPILDRAFDVWQKRNENYYWEMANAIYANDGEKFGKLLDKYQIRWLLLDENIVAPSSDKALYLSELKDMIRSLSSKISLSADFGKIKVYRVNLGRDVRSYVFLADSLPLVEPSSDWMENDRAYLEMGDYISDVRGSKPKVQSEKRVYYPFRSLFTGRKQEDIEFNLKEKPAYFSFISQLSREMAGGSLFLPDYSKYFATGLLKVFLGGRPIIPADSSDTVFIPDINDEVLEVRVAKEKIRLYDGKDPILDVTAKKPLACDRFNQGVYQQDLVEMGEEVYLRLTSIDSSNCVSFNLPSLPQKDSYLLSVESGFAEGKPLSFLLMNNHSTRPEIITSLPKEKGINNSVFVVPAREPLGYGYTLHFDNTSIGRVTTVNYLGGMAVYKMPYNFLAGMKIIKSKVESRKSKVESREAKVRTVNRSLTVEHPNPSLYEVAIANGTSERSDNKIIVLAQAYDSGWRAYRIFNSQFSILNAIKKWFPFVFGESVGEHVLVNNWENGWQIDSSRFEVRGSRVRSEIIIVYLPQYLQYLGFLSLGIVPFTILRWRRW